MTAISYVTPKQMEQETGSKLALGYALPKEDKILIRKGLSKKKKKEVLAHEEEHIAKGEEGPWIGAAIAAGASLLSGAMGSKSSKKAGKKAKKGSDRQIEFAREAMNLARADTRHSRQAGATALNALMSMTGLAPAGGGGGGAPPGAPVAEPAPEGLPTQQDFADNIAPGGQYRSAYNIQNRFGGGPMAGAMSSMYNINEMGPENVYAGGGVTRAQNPMTIDSQMGYVQPNAESYIQSAQNAASQWQPKRSGMGGRMRQMAKQQQAAYAGAPQGAAMRQQAGRGMMGQMGSYGANIQGRAGGGELWAATGGDPLIGAVSGVFDGSGQGGGQGDPYGSGRRGELPGTDWVRNDAGKIIKTGIGHWNEGQGQYVDRRGRARQNQAAPPEGYVDPATQTDIDTTLGQDYDWQTDPGYDFRFEEGQRALERGAAARGGLLSGGFGRKAIRYGQNFASNEYSNVYNRIANIAGMGQVANQGAANAAQYGGQGMGAGAAASGINSAYGAIGSGNAWQNAGDQLAQVDWGSIFNRGG